MRVDAPYPLPDLYPHSICPHLRLGELMQAYRLRLPEEAS